MSSTQDAHRLVERWKAGDRLAGDELLGLYFESIHRFFDNKVDHDVDELIQRTFLACAESIERFRGEGTFRSYLYAIARNELRQYFVRKHQDGQRRVDLSTQSVADLATSQATRVARKQDEQRLHRALRTIPIDLQIVVELHHWEGLTMEELAAVLEIPVGTVKSRIRRAKEKLGEAMQR